MQYDSRNQNSTYFKQDVGDDLNVCVLNLLPEVSILPSLVSISLVKVKIKTFQSAP